MPDQRRDGRGLRVDPGTDLLEREGLLKSEWVEGEGPRPRKYYHLTTAGRTRMRTMAEEFRAIAAGMEQMIVGVMGDEQ